MNTTPELFSDTDAAKSASDQDVQLEFAPKTLQISSDVPRDLRFGSVVRHFRQKKGLTQLQLSRALEHMTPEWAGMIESGQRKINLDEIPQLAAVLHLSASDLGKLAVREYLPKLATALFDDPSREGEVPAPENEGTTDLLPASTALAQAFQELTAKRRQVVTAMVQALQKSSVSDVRGGAERHGGGENKRLKTRRGRSIRWQLRLL